MKKFVLFPMLFVIFCLFTTFSGCIAGSDDQNEENNIISEKESLRLAEVYVKNLESYREYKLTEPVLVRTRAFDNPFCWKFDFEFDLISEKDPSVIDTATVEVTVLEGEVVEAVYAQGSRYKLGIPTGSIGVDSLLENPVYDTEVFVYGTVSGFEKRPGTSFNLNWEEAALYVEMAEPAAGMKNVENGDWVIVTGELKSRVENGTEPFFLAKLVQTEDIPENELFTGEVVQADEKKMVVWEIPANETAQAYRVRYEVIENESRLLFKEEIFEDISPENPIEIEVSDVKAGSTYTIRVFIRNMEGRILCDAEHVGGFGVEEKFLEPKGA